jgi:hypothetical protein
LRRGGDRDCSTCCTIRKEDPPENKSINISKHTYLTAENRLLAMIIILKEL